MSKVMAPSTADAAVAARVGEAEAPAQGSKVAHDLDEASRQFEQIFVKSILEQSPMGKKGDAYSDMATSALATAVTQGKGLGLGELVKRAVEMSEHALKKSG
jgi:Rod binding domain-containing protein